ncbi:MAG: carboxypeptidase-like regulatory domain-containing protein [Candidatus Nomurabacteria bacterium]|nr:carboxypeptidase-like regulatory domain-containing protein [Candidatus Nomurabacteria bacterium]
MENKYHKNKYIVFVGILSFFCVVIFGPYIINAADLSGTIDNVYKYAKGSTDPTLKINFGLFRGSIHVDVTDSNLTGFAWGEKIGWVNLAPSGAGVFNDGEGNLYGYATSEFGGWLNFSPNSGGVKINSDGEFTGYALSQKFGIISFNCINDNSCTKEDYKVKTDWRPISFRKDGTPPVLIIKNIEPPVVSLIVDTTDNIVIKKDANSPKQMPIGNIGQYESSSDIVKNNNTPVITGGITYIMPEDSTPIKKNVSISGNKIVNDINISVPQKENKSNISSVIKIKSTQIRDEVVNVANSDTLDIGAKTVTTAGVVGGSTTIVSSLIFNAISFSEFFLNFFRLWSLFLSAIGLKKKLRPWGTVYDSVTKQPLDPVYVVLSDKNGKEVSTAITDMDGRFGFLVPPGWYALSVKKNNYIFPSKKMDGKSNDTIYENLYFGELMYLEDGKTITKNIPMDPERFDWNEFTKKDKNLLKFNSPNASIFAKISNFLFYLGFVFSVLLVLINGFSYYNVGVISFYIILMIFRKINIKSKTHGTIKEKDTMFPLSFAIIRVFQKGGTKEIFHRVADKYGNYYCLLPKGEYYIVIDKKNNDESYTYIYKSENLILRNGILNKDFVV